MFRLYLCFTLLCLLFVNSVAIAADQLEPVLKERGRHFQTEGEIVPIPDDGIHDPYSVAAGVLQDPFVAMQGFPRDNAGIVDWEQAIRKDYIEPRADIDGVTKNETFDLDIIFTNTGAMPNVRFPHSSHTLWLACSNCHPDIFIQKKGANKFKMTDILQGRYCGVCHGKVSFPPTLNCVRCHSVTKTASANAK
jgi:c(7)-type cytochrome triheme protein